jgi:tetratricopeptide (TPR) repeat protein
MIAISKTRAPRSRPFLFLSFIVFVAIAASACVSKHEHQTREDSSGTHRSVKFVGATVCASCHAHENGLWKGSHHQQAMQPADERTVLGAFNNTKFSNAGVTSTFYRDGARFMVRTEGPDGGLHDYQIKFTFGVYPLQQYLIEMPGGRLQALGIAWDCRPANLGGQRWFHLFPGQSIKPGDGLHWTGIDQNWNYMCADCHSTNVRKNYDARNRTYATTYSEINVSCEACHGPGSRHVEWAGRQNDWKDQNSSKGLLIALDERRGVTWSVSPGTGEVLRSVPRKSDREIQMCARCHSRRGQICEDYVHGQEVGDDYRVAFLDSDLYFPDGQIKAEDYEYGSFIQSRMFHAGVTCSDCHEPHGGKLHAEGNTLCLQCHSASRYDSPKHHFHKVGSAGARCVNCHMPTRTYMVIDERRDHSLRVPRPDQSVKVGVPNACNGCHTDKSAKWASTTVESWYGHKVQGFQRFAEALSAGAEGSPDANRLLSILILDQEQPAIARASALSEMADYAPSSQDRTISESSTAESNLVRRAVTNALSDSDPRNQAVGLAPLLNDPVRSVRLQVGEALAGIASELLHGEQAIALKRDVDEYIESLDLNADRPESHMNLGLLYEKLKEPDKAEMEFQVALSLDSSFAPAAVDLADLYRAENRDADGERVLRAAIAREPNDASLQHALGLLMIRQKQFPEALRLLAGASRADPTNARYAYVYAVALHDSGQRSAAIGVLEEAVKSRPYDRDCLGTLAIFLLEEGSPAAGLPYAERLAQLEPNNPDVLKLVTQLRATKR